ncbi:unnamed protein product [Laminaria digitata]
MQTYRRADRQRGAVRMAMRPSGRRTDRPTSRNAHRQAQADKQTGRQAERKDTDGAHRHTSHRHTKTQVNTKTRQTSHRPLYSAVTCLSCHQTTLFLDESRHVFATLPQS